MTKVNSGAALKRKELVTKKTEAALVEYEKRYGKTIVPSEFYAFTKEHGGFAEVNSGALERSKVKLKELVQKKGLTYLRKRNVSKTPKQLLTLLQDANVVYVADMGVNDLIDAIAKHQKVGFGDVQSYVNRVFGPAEIFFDLFVSGIEVTEESIQDLSQAELKKLFSKKHLKLKEQKSISIPDKTIDSEYLYSFRAKPGVWVFGRTATIEHALADQKSKGVLGELIEVRVFESSNADFVEKLVSVELERVGAVKVENSTQQYYIKSAAAIALWNYVLQLAKS
ncbi:hypothetical protein AAFX20_10060 [Vibrio chagasii]|uniref:hypothetical protein n=1 Tax=Vibrio chagasii TaxID=170679 RepID=UPI0038CDBACD